MCDTNVIELDFNANCSISHYTKYEDKNVKPNNLMCKQTLLMNTLNIYFKDIKISTLMIYCSSSSRRTTHFNMVLLYIIPKTLMHN